MAAIDPPILRGGGRRTDRASHKLGPNGQGGRAWFRQARLMQSWAADSLARNWHPRDKTARTRDLLSAVYDWFTKASTDRTRGAQKLCWKNFLESAFGYKQTSSRPKSKSALPPATDIHVPPPRSQRHAVRSCARANRAMATPPGGGGANRNPTPALFAGKIKDTMSCLRPAGPGFYYR